MAPSAINGDSMAMLEDIKAPPGVVLPPKEIKGASLNFPEVQKG
jgi:splicing factor 3A subunit 1